MAGPLPVDVAGDAEQQRALADGEVGCGRFLERALGHLA